MLQLLLTIYFLLFLSNSVHGLVGDQCDIHDLRNSCGQFEVCDKSTCQCLFGVSKPGSICTKFEKDTSTKIQNSDLPPNSSSLVNKQKGGSFIKHFLVPFFLLLTLVGGVYLAKKYNMVYWIRNKVQSYRRTNYDEFMIGQDVDDDPPLR